MVTLGHVHVASVSENRCLWSDRSLWVVQVVFTDFPVWFYVLDRNPK